MINLSLSKEIQDYLLSKYPEEGCGFVLKDNTFVPCENVSLDKTKEFEISNEDYLKCEWDIKAIVHSHPDGKDQPSRRDMSSQISTNVPFGLCVTRPGWVSPLWFWGDGIPDVPLVGRPFRHGATGTDGKGDCFSLIRDYFRIELGIKLREYPRDDSWWANGQDMYSDYFKEEGFYEIPQEEVRENDCFIMKINSDVMNHAGIYIGNGLILHHLALRLSRREPIGRWPKMVVKWVRHKDVT